ncbi:MAG: SAM-dependent chlorinase/fluorinase [Rhodospirillaceae bacterium]|nr:SAM-dependent chlorinase/fluorinase [Rhodospirillaceae bacterium]
MIFLFTDFGQTGPYVGQVHAVLKRSNPAIAVIDLMHDAPAFNPKAASYLLPAVLAQVRPGDVVMAVVDPGVGSPRACVALNADGVWYLGPDNGLLSQVQRRAVSSQAFVLPVPSDSSATFHGRDIFAPAAAELCAGRVFPDAAVMDAAQLDRSAWPNDLAEVIYVDGYGNAMTGLRVSSLKARAMLAVGDRVLTRARTFSDVPVERLFWTENSIGLVEVAQNTGNAAKTLGLEVGSLVAVAT